MQNMKKKFGISLITLAITIIVALILLSAIIISVGDYLQRSRLSKIVSEVAQTQDAVNSYYVLNNSLPIDETTNVIVGVDDFANLASDSNKDLLKEEVELNNDSQAQFLKLDNRLLEISNTDKNYYLSYPNLNVYDIDGMRINNDVYFSISSKIGNNVKIEIQSKENNNSKTVITKGANLKVSSSTLENTNKMDVKIECTKQANFKMYMDLSGIGKKEISNSKEQK